MSTETWPTVDAFARQMKEKLNENKEKGNRSVWVAEGDTSLLRRLKEEVQELEELLTFVETIPAAMWNAPGIQEALAKEMAKEAADVGNFAMMIADKYGGLLK